MIGRNGLRCETSRIRVRTVLDFVIRSEAFTCASEVTEVSSVRKETSSIEWQPNRPRCRPSGHAAAAPCRSGRTARQKSSPAVPACGSGSGACPRALAPASPARQPPPNPRRATTASDRMPVTSFFILWIPYHRCSGQARAGFNCALHSVFPSTASVMSSGMRSASRSDRGSA